MPGREGCSESAKALRQELYERRDLPVKVRRFFIMAALSGGEGSP
jgi:hypothetical protein